VAERSARRRGSAVTRSTSPTMNSGL
jgi:hypothetical protein